MPNSIGPQNLTLYAFGRIFDDLTIRSSKYTSSVLMQNLTQGTNDARSKLEDAGDFPIFKRERRRDGGLLSRSDWLENDAGN